MNRLYLRVGRLPEPGRTGEVAVTEPFALAHRMEPGSTFTALLNGRRQVLTVIGIVLSPEYIYAVGPGDMMPDPRRFGVFFMSRAALAGLFDMNAAFNDVALRTQRGANLRIIVDDLDRILRPYGGSGAYDRKDQVSHSFLDNELIQLRAMAAVIPPVFLFVAAFLVNMILSRLITLEREQIGLLKAIGFGPLAIAWHYAKLTLLIVAIGLAIGALSGNWMGRSLTRLYAEFSPSPSSSSARASTSTYWPAASPSSPRLRVRPTPSGASSSCPRRWPCSRRRRPAIVPSSPEAPPTCAFSRNSPSWRCGTWCAGRCVRC